MVVGRQEADAPHDAAGTMIGGGGEEEREADGEAAEVEAHGKTAVPTSGNAHELKRGHRASADGDVFGHVGGTEAEVGNSGGGQNGANGQHAGEKNDEVGAALVGRDLAEERGAAVGGGVRLLRRLGRALDFHLHDGEGWGRRARSGSGTVDGAHCPFGVGLLEGFHLAGKGFEGADAEHRPSHLRHAEFIQCAFSGDLEALGLGEGGIGGGIGGSHELPHGEGMGIGGRTAEGGHDVFKQGGLRRVELQRGQGVVVMVHKQGVETQR